MLGLTVMLVAIAALVWARLTQLSSGDEPALKKGAIALKRALQGEPAAFQEAEAQFERAARGVVLDAYPVFALELTQQLARGKVKVTSDELEPVVQHLKAGRIDDARRALNALPQPGKYRWLERLLADMG